MTPTMSRTSFSEAPAREAESARRAGIWRALAVLERRWWILAVVVAVAVGVSLARSLSEKKQYTATSALLFQDTDLDQAFFGSPALAPSTDAQQEANTNTELVSLSSIGEVAAPTLRREGVHINALNVNNAVSVQQAGQSNVVDLLATMPSPIQAAEVANAYAQAYVTFRRNNDQAKVQQAIQLVQTQLGVLPPQSARAIELTHDLSQLQVLKALQTGNASVVQAATPPAGPSAPRTKRSAAIAAVLGAIVGIILMLLAERLDRRIRDVDELQEIFQKPILAAVPVDTGLTTAAAASEHAASLEPFRILRANLAYFRVGRERRSLVVASGSPSEGKTTVAINLAIAAAIAGQRVLLLEADLRQPGLARQLGIESAPRGLAQVLSGQVNFSDAVQSLPLTEIPSAEDGYLDVLLAGAVPPNPAELVESDDMARLLSRLEQEYELIVIDTPPITVVSDALLLLHRGHGVIIVARLNQTTRDTAIRLRDQLATIDVSPLGVVVNAVPARGTSYHYYGGYGSYRSGGDSPTSPNGGGPSRTPVTASPE